MDDEYASAGTQPRWWVRRRPLPWWRRWLDRRLAQADVVAPDGDRFHIRVLRGVPLRDSPLGPFDNFLPQPVSLAVLVGANLSARRRARWLLQVLRAETPWRASHVIYTRKVRGGTEVADLALELAAAVQRGDIPSPASGNDHIRRTVKKIMNWD